MVRIGAPGSSPPTYDAGHNPLLVTGGVHAGTEPAGREAALTWVRNMAYATGAQATYLASHPVFIIPTVNPDGVGNGVAGDEVPPGKNPNRDGLQLQSTVMQVFGAVVTKIKPQFFVDCHELSVAATEDAWLEFWQNKGAYSGLNTLGQSMFSSVMTAVQARGRTVAPYPEPMTSGSSTQDVVALMHGLNFLIETDPTDGTIAYRVGIHIDVLECILNWHAANDTTLASTQASARSAALSNSGPYIFQYSNTTLNPAPVSYVLTGAQNSAISAHRAAFGIVSTPIGDTGNWRVSMSQETRGMIPLIMDATSDVGNEVIAATRDFTAINDPKPPTYGAPQVVGTATGGRNGAGTFVVTPPPSAKGWIALVGRVAATSYTAPSGWSLIRSGGSADSLYLVYMANTTAPGATWTFADNAARPASVVVIGYDAPITEVGWAESTQTTVAPSATASAAPALALTGLIDANDSTASLIYPSGATISRVQKVQPEGGGVWAQSVGAAHFSVAGPGPTGTSNWSVTAAYQPNAFTLVLQGTYPPVADEYVVLMPNGTEATGTIQGILMPNGTIVPVTLNVVE
jgi:hypothetical protein